MLELTSEKPGPDAVEEELPPPPPPEPEPPPAEEESAIVEDEWDLDYEEHIDGEEPKVQKKPKKKRHYGAMIVVSAVLIFLILWTILSPKVMPAVGDVYVDSEDYYANLGNYTGERSIWAGDMSWGVSFRGANATDVGTAIDITVLITKVAEKPGNWFFRGTSIVLKNISLYDEDGNCVGAMSNWTDVGIGKAATVPVSFSASGSYNLYAYVRFMVFMDMRIGYLPLETIQIPQIFLDVPIVVYQPPLQLF